jgi:hydroxymethylglutaryl-CoA lyase
MTHVTEIAIRDVTLRDGLQDERPVSTDEKIALFDCLVGAGITDLELTSFVRPDRVPSMADAEEMVRRTAATPGVTRWGLVLNDRGAMRALESGLSHLQYVISVSDAHQVRNAGKEIRLSVQDLERIVALSTSDGSSSKVQIEVTLATAFGCPYAGPVRPRDVVDLAQVVAAAGASGISVADTIGTAVPTEVAALVDEVQALDLGLPLGIHLHDTRGLGIANALAAIESGIDRVDGTVGGLGGCPFAPGASGNLAVEDLAHGLEEMHIATGLDVLRLIDAANLACKMVGKSVASHVGIAGPRFAAVETSRRKREA